MAAIFKFPNAFSSMKLYEVWLRFHWSLFLRVQWTIFQHWFQSNGLVPNRQLASILSNGVLSHWRVFASLGSDELRQEEGPSWNRQDLHKLGKIQKGISLLCFSWLILEIFGSRLYIGSHCGLMPIWPIGIFTRQKCIRLFFVIEQNCFLWGHFGPGIIFAHCNVKNEIRMSCLLIKID